MYHMGCRSKWDLNSHLEQNHPELKGSGACVECRTVLSATMLRLHFFKLHSIRNHLCPVCGKMLKYFSQLKVDEVATVCL